MEKIFVDQAIADVWEQQKCTEHKQKKKKQQNCGNNNRQSVLML